jgi:hypothetical protein
VSAVPVVLWSLLIVSSDVVLSSFSRMWPKGVENATCE